MSFDADIDALYQLPLNEFIAARNALAKRAGAAAPAIKALEKPNAPAWAVNQLYWARRGVFDRLAKAAEQLRAAHTARLAGKSADVARAEDAHRVAREAAVREARTLLKDGGDAATPATMTAVTETLDSLPWAEPA